MGTARSEVPTSNSIPTKVAPSGTGAALALVSGPVRHAYALPSRSKNTSPQLTAATAVISETSSLVQVHTESIQGESDPRVSNCSCAIWADAQLHSRSPPTRAVLAATLTTSPRSS